MGSSLREAVIFKSRGGLSANEKEEKFASNDNLFCEQNNSRSWGGALRDDTKNGCVAD